VPHVLADRARLDEKQHRGVADGPSTGDRGVTVLVADDDPISRSLCVRAIHERCHVYQAETGYEALHLLAVREEIEVVLLDMRMPGLHGLEILSELERIRPDVLVIVLTGYAPDLPAELVGRGVVAKLISKPYGIGEIRAAVAETAALRQGLSQPVN
jgi:CheY-like chemotaxis protein